MLYADIGISVLRSWYRLRSNLRTKVKRAVMSRINSWSIPPIYSIVYGSVRLGSSLRLRPPVTEMILLGSGTNGSLPSDQSYRVVVSDIGFTCPASVDAAL